MARSTGSSSRTGETRFHGNRADEHRADEHRADEHRADGNRRDPAPDDDNISGKRADYAPTGTDSAPTTGGTLKRTVKEFSEDNLTDWAAALTYYGVLALFPALIALVSLIGLVVSPQTLAKALTGSLTSVIPRAAHGTGDPSVQQEDP